MASIPDKFLELIEKQGLLEAVLNYDVESVDNYSLRSRVLKARRAVIELLEVLER